MLFRSDRLRKHEGTMMSCRRLGEALRPFEDPGSVRYGGFSTGILAEIRSQFHDYYKDWVKTYDYQQLEQNRMSYVEK